MTARRFVMFGDMSNIKQYVLDKEDNKTFDSKWALMDKLNELAEENERLKQQLYCDSDNGVCSICANHYLVKGKTYDKYYISKCKKGHEECSIETLKHCKHFKVRSRGDD